MFYTIIERQEGNRKEKERRENGKPKENQENARKLRERK